MLIAFVAALAALPVSATKQYPGQNNRPQACRFDMDRGAMVLMIANGERTVAPGEVVTVDPRWTPYPSAWDPVPRSCLDGWRLSRGAPARLAADGASVRLDDDAAEGSRFELTARYRGRTITQAFRVIRPIVSPLVGIWTQDEAACPGGDAVFELVFRRDGSFAVTFEPEFHSRIDYGGRWQVEGDRLVLSNVTAAGSQPPPASAGEGSTYRLLDDGRLEFASPWYGHRSGELCRAAFRRQQ